MRVCNYSKSSLQNKRLNQRTRLLLRLACKTKNEKTPQNYLELKGCKKAVDPDTDPVWSVQGIINIRIRNETVAIEHIF
jgi:hypothetical protein